MSECNYLYASCDPFRLYDHSSFPESSENLSELRIHAAVGEYVADLYPKFSYERDFDPDQISTNVKFKEHLKTNREAIQNGKTGAASAVFRLRDVVVRDRVIYVKTDSGYSVIYETFRPCDRHNSSLASIEDLGSAPMGAEDDDICLFMGSTGCFNYGHWLSDDLIKISAFWSIRNIHPSKHIIVVIAAHNSKIDEIKKESIRFLLSKDQNFSIRMFARPTSVAFKSLYYASPASYPGALKSPEAIGYLHVSAIEALMRHRPTAVQNYMKAHGGTGERIFVDRGSEHSRGLMNSKEIYQVLKEKRFNYVNPENFSFIDQVEMFCQASVIVGNMGAGMTNTIFCRPNSQIIYLAPEGWDDAFFWDLATVMHQKHHAIYGPRQTEESSSRYGIDPSLIAKIVEKLT